MRTTTEAKTRKKTAIIEIIGVICNSLVPLSVGSWNVVTSFHALISSESQETLKHDENICVLNFYFIF